MNWYKTAFNIISDFEKVFEAFLEMEGIPLGTTHGWEEWLELRKTLTSYPEEIQDEMREEANVSIYGRGGWHRYMIDGNGNVSFSAMHADNDEIKKAKGLGFLVE